MNKIKNNYFAWFSPEIAESISKRGKELIRQMIPQFNIGDTVKYPLDGEIALFTITDCTYSEYTDTHIYALKNEHEQMWVSSVSLRFYNEPTRCKN